MTPKHFENLVKQAPTDSHTLTPYVPRKIASELAGDTRCQLGEQCFTGGVTCESDQQGLDSQRVFIHEINSNRSTFARRASHRPDDRSRIAQVPAALEGNAPMGKRSLLPALPRADTRHLLPSAVLEGT